MAIFKFEIRVNRWSTLAYTLSMILVFTIFLYFFDTFKESASVMDALLKNFPPEFKAAFGFSEVNLADFNGYLTFLFTYVLLIGAVFGMKLGLSVLSEEGRVKTSDFLLTKPIKRYQIASYKIAAVLFLLVIQNLFVYGFTWFQIDMIILESANQQLLMLLSASIFLVQLFFVGIGLCLSVMLRRIKNVMPITLGVVFFFFIVELVNQSLLDKNLTYLTPFSYFKGSELLKALSYNPVYVGLDLSVFLIFTLMAYVIYVKKDVHAV